MPVNRNLHKARANRMDEFYTQLSDIENELRHYRDHFHGKIVYCNCDDPTISNFYRYFQLNFEFFGLKKLITTCFKSRQMDMFSQHDKENAIGIEYTGDKPEVFHLKGDGDFRSQECIELLKQADIVVTNPPFSLFREYVAQLMEYEKQFLIIGNMNALTYKEIFPLIQRNQIWLGHAQESITMLFDVPAYYVQELLETKKEGSAYIIVNGKVMGKMRNAKWFTNLDHKKRHEELLLYKRYSPEEFPKYDNYDAINVDKTKEIPYDYDGAMGVPISFLDKHSPEQFEIVGLDRPLMTELTGKVSRFWLEGTEKYARIVIRRKPAVL
ncbi:MAG: adenine-specific methyltransferase EcoRI family protein [Chloroflexota bacterium]|nr:adenine-specific methyltransferase EcoRI family protein [Chloroflexota bacterium]